jgi:hypothetical protein
MAAKRKTVLRTIRIPAELAEILERDAEAKRTTVNALLVTILTKYAEWDRVAEKYGLISLPRHGFRRLLEAADEKELYEVSRELGGHRARETILFWFGKVNLETFLAYLKAFSRYAGLAEVEIETDGVHYTMRGHHELGERWSNVLKNFMEEAFRSTLGLVPRFETTKNALVVRFDTLGR